MCPTHSNTNRLVAQICGPLFTFILLTLLTCMFPLFCPLYLSRYTTIIPFYHAHIHTYVCDIAQGFYDRSKLFWKEVENTTLCAACAPPGGGRQEMSARFVRHFTLLNVPPPSDRVGTKSRQSVFIIRKRKIFKHTLFN